MKNLILIFSLISICLVGFVVGVQLETNPIAMSVGFGVVAIASGVFGFVPNGALGVSVCGEIATNIVFDCDAPLQSGTRERAWVINFEDIDSVTYNATNKKIVESITLKATKVAYYIDGKNNSIAPSTALVRQTFGSAFDHIVNMKGFDISPNVKDNLDKAKEGRFIVITENNFKGATGNSAFEIYGLTTGLEMTTLTRNPNDAATMGAFDFTFGTDVNKEPGLPHTFFITSYAASKTAIEGLL